LIGDDADLDPGCVFELMRAEPLARIRERPLWPDALEWEREHPDAADPEQFSSELLPHLIDVSARKLSRRTGLSAGYWAQVKRGERVPHPRWWSDLRLSETEG
jgi:hypothetical protein